jgi:hypothetical protein
MRSLLCWLMVLCGSSVCAQDPTVPSAQILERLHSDPREPPAPISLPRPAMQAEPALPPVIKLRAMVLSDSDHGTALLDIDGRHVRLKLSRPVAGHSAETAGLDGVTIQGALYRVESFSARAIMLVSRGQTLLVQ